jgi:hypothetical protein
MSTNNLPGSKRCQARKAGFTPVCQPTVLSMWEPRRLTTLWACTDCYRDSFILLPQEWRITELSGFQKIECQFRTLWHRRRKWDLCPLQHGVTASQYPPPELHPRVRGYRGSSLIRVPFLSVIRSGSPRSHGNDATSSEGVRGETTHALRSATVLILS